MELGVGQHRRLKDSLRVAAVEAGSVAAAVGVRPGDVVLAIDGSEVKGLQQYAKMIAARKADRPLRIVVER